MIDLENKFIVFLRVAVLHRLRFTVDSWRSENIPGAYLVKTSDVQSQKLRKNYKKKVFSE